MVTHQLSNIWKDSRIVSHNGAYTWVLNPYAPAALLLRKSATQESAATSALPLSSSAAAASASASVMRADDMPYCVTRECTLTAFVLSRLSDVCFLQACQQALARTVLPRILVQVDRNHQLCSNTDNISFQRFYSRNPLVCLSP